MVEVGIRVDTGFQHEVRVSQGQINRAIADVIDEVVEQTLTLVFQDVSLALGILDNVSKERDILRDTIDRVVFKRSKYSDVVELQDRFKTALGMPVVVEK